MKDNGTEDMMMHGIMNDKVCLYDEAELQDCFNGRPLKVSWNSYSSLFTGYTLEFSQSNGIYLKAACLREPNCGCITLEYK